MRITSKAWKTVIVGIICLMTAAGAGCGAAEEPSSAAGKETASEQPAETSAAEETVSADEAESSEITDESSAVEDNSEEAPEILKNLYDALIAEGSDLSKSQAVLEEFDDGSSLEATLGANDITFTEIDGENPDEPSVWVFTLDGDLLTIDLDPEDTEGAAKANLILKAAASAQNVDCDLFNGYLCAYPEKYDEYIIDERETDSKLAVNIAKSYQFDMAELEGVAIGADVIEMLGYEPKTEEFIANIIFYGKLKMYVFGDVNGMEFDIREYGELDSSAYDSVINIVKYIQPNGWEDFVAGYTELKDADEEGYYAKLNLTGDELSEVTANPVEGHSYAVIKIGNTDWEE